jgi:hypothetical protein
MGDPRRRRRWPGTVPALLAALVVLLAGCGDEGTPVSAPPTVTAPRDDSAEVMAAAVQRLITRDHTFGTGEHRFAEYLIVDHIDATAGAPGRGDSGGGRALTGSERAAIAGVVAPFGPYRFVADAAGVRSGAATPPIEGSVVVGVGAPALDADAATVPVSLWCGSLCGTWMTYRLARVGDAWRVTGTEGPVAIS